MHVLICSGLKIKRPYKMEKGIFLCVQQYNPMRVITHHLIIYVFTFEIRVLLCLKRALKIANSAQQMASTARGSPGSVTLFIEILNK